MTATLNNTGIILSNAYKVPHGLNLPFAGRFLTAIGRADCSVEFSAVGMKFVWLENARAELLAKHAEKVRTDAADSFAVQHAKGAALEAWHQSDVRADSINRSRESLMDYLDAEEVAEPLYSRAVAAYDAEVIHLFPAKPTVPTPAMILETILKFSPRNPIARTSAMATVTACETGEFVTVAEFKDARETLSRGIDEAHDGAKSAVVKAIADADGDRAAAVASLERVWYVFGLVSLAAAHKRMGADETIHADVRTVLAAAAALKALLDSAKAKATPGRRPAEKTAPVKPRVLDMGTCAFCRRLQSVRGGMVEHGYTESRYGFRAGSCGGTHTQPIETSPDGPRALLHALESSRTHAQGLLDNPPTSHTVDVRNGTRVTPTVFTSGPKFERAAERCRLEALRTVATADEHIPKVTAEIAAWAPGKLVTAAEATARGI